MTEQEKLEILVKAKAWFRDVIIPKHLLNTKKLAKPKKLDINPFLTPYIAVFLTGELTPDSVARAILYPRVLGSSITTSFGQNIQRFISVALGSYGSMVQGIDIEFTDAVDGRKKYCQVKLGPNTINKDDVITIHNHFRTAKNLGKTNHLQVQQHDLVIGILYGELGQESNHYKKLRDAHDYSLYIGKDFWHRLTGDHNFYTELKKVFNEVAIDANGTEAINEVVAALAQTPEVKFIAGE